MSTSRRSAVWSRTCPLAKEIRPDAPGQGDHCATPLDPRKRGVIVGDDAPAPNQNRANPKPNATPHQYAMTPPVFVARHTEYAYRRASILQGTGMANALCLSAHFCTPSADLPKPKTTPPRPPMPGGLQFD